MRNENEDIAEVLISEQELDAIVADVAARIDRDYGESSHRILLVAILKSSAVFFADLIRKIHVPVEVDFMKISSYGGATKTSGQINVHLDLQRTDLSDYEVIIVEDIVDSGRTLSYLTEHLMQKGARSVRACSLLDKPCRRRVDIAPVYVGRVVPDLFVVGYGLDFDEKYRSLPYIGVLKPSAYES